MSDKEQFVTNDEMATMCRQFSSLTTANVNVLDIFDTLEAQAENPFLREVLQKVREYLEMGHTLATAFNLYPNTFSPFFITMIREGELEGELARAFEELADHFDSRLDDTVDGRRAAGRAAMDFESAAGAFQWLFIWAVALLAFCALGAGLVWYATGDGGAGLPGSRIPNILLFIGAVMGLGVLLFSRGRKKR